jgi:hypothetical protein
MSTMDSMNSLATVNRLMTVPFPCAWQVHAVETYLQGKSNVRGKLRTELVGRVQVLTGREVLPDLVYADPDKQLARVSVDGVSFRLTHGRVVLLSPCAYCGLREFESSAIESPDDLGYALSVWTPYCRDCVPEDPHDCYCD